MASYKNLHRHGLSHWVVLYLVGLGAEYGKFERKFGLDDMKEHLPRTVKMRNLSTCVSKMATLLVALGLFEVQGKKYEGVMYKSRVSKRIMLKVWTIVDEEYSWVSKVRNFLDERN